ncbi:MAG: hypothetical protein EAX91_03010 [Candidatus Lokiarchaeota archaeon]|nr:hypothetical protein [Candidatus Lokiarchaeota archaeon]
MIDGLLIINDTGALLYNWHPKNYEGNGKDDLFSGFLTAINSFATVERGEDIKSLKLKETQLIFEKYEELTQKLTFVITTKNEEFIELLHAVIHDLMDIFTEQFQESLNKPFDGAVTLYQKFGIHVDQILKSHGLDVLDDAIRDIDDFSTLKSIVYLEPKGGNIYYIHAKQYVNKEKISFLIPLLMNSAKLLYQNNLNERLYWILLNTVRSEILVVEPRNKVLIVKQHQLTEDLEEEFLSLEFFKDKDRYIKKPKKLIEKFENIEWNPFIKQIYLVDMVGKIFYSNLIDNTFDCSDFVPETISFLTSSKKISDEIYNRTLFNASIGGEKFATICINFNNFTLIVIGSIKDLSSFSIIQELCSEIYRKLK